MTEQEIIEKLNENNDFFNFGVTEPYKTIIKALEEVRQIREIIKDFTLDCGSTVSDVKEMYRQLNEYLKIGTVEELKEAKEKQIAKKPLPIITDDNEFICVICPTCQQIAVEVDDAYCRKCGQKILLDWGNEDDRD